MTDFDALLKRSFAEAAEPADDGFSVAVSHSVAHRESTQRVRNAAYSTGMAAAGAAVLYGVYGLVTAFGQEFLASAGLELARAHGALSSTGGPPSAQTIMQSMGAGMSQVLLITAVLAGGAVAYRATQD